MYHLILPISDTVCNNGDFLLCFTVSASVEQAENTVVREGDNVEMHCNVIAGIPDPTVIWLQVATGEKKEENPLKITNISRAQAGEYRCTANNTCGEESTVTDIDVQCKNISSSIFNLSSIVKP